MTFPVRKYFWMTAGIVLGMTAPLFAQNRESVSTAELSHPGRSPVLKSPVDLFRELLAMEPAERAKVIAARPPAIRKRIEEKLEQYQLLPDGVREWRLRETELRYYLVPLMSLPPTNRAARLALIPEEPRKLVEQRLETWDILPPELQKEFLTSEMIRAFLSRVDSEAAREEWAKQLIKLTPEQAADLEEGLKRWRGLSEGERRKSQEAFEKFVTLTPEEREKTLNTLSDEERKEMEATLAEYTKLTPVQRAQCLRSFEKFTGMSRPERQQFLKNVERWKEMSPEERQAWRDLVASAPIMPLAEAPRMPMAIPKRPAARATN